MKASEILKTKGWLRGKLADTAHVDDPEAGAYCVGGALMVSYGCNTLTSDALKLAGLDTATAKIAEHLFKTKRAKRSDYSSEKYPFTTDQSWFVMVDWNNRVAKTKTEVIKVLEACGE